MELEIKSTLLLIMTKKRLKGVLINWTCQFCKKDSPSVFWKKNKCPKCKREYNDSEG